MALTPAQIHHYYYASPGPAPEPVVTADTIITKADTTIITADAS